MQDWAKHMKAPLNCHLGGCRGGILGYNGFGFEDFQKLGSLVGVPYLNQGHSVLRFILGLSIFGIAIFRPGPCPAAESEVVLVVF